MESMKLVHSISLLTLLSALVHAQPVWESHSQNFHNFSVAVLPNDNVAICGTQGRILISTDMGKNWQRVQAPSRKNLHTISFFSVPAGIAGGDAGTILLTAVGGNTWR